MKVTHGYNTETGRTEEIIDIEPKWEDLCKMAMLGRIKPDALLPACQTADIIRQAQKQGKTKVTFTFGPNNECNVDVE